MGFCRCKLFDSLYTTIFLLWWCLIRSKLRSIKWYHVGRLERLKRKGDIFARVFGYKFSVFTEKLYPIMRFMLCNYTSLVLVLEVATFGWTKWCALELKTSSMNVAMTTGDRITAAMEKMLA